MKGKVTIIFGKHKTLYYNDKRFRYSYKIRQCVIVVKIVCLNKVKMLYFLFANVSVTCGTIMWMRNQNPGASKPSKSLEDHTRPGPHQPLSWLNFLVSPPDNNMFQTWVTMQNKAHESNRSIEIWQVKLLYYLNKKSTLFYKNIVTN